MSHSQQRQLCLCCLLYTIMMSRQSGNPCGRPQTTVSCHGLPMVLWDGRTGGFEAGPTFVWEHLRDYVDIHHRSSTAGPVCCHFDVFDFAGYHHAHRLGYHQLVS
ncbi:hypothetical protein DPEC_G00380640 [Dallia pectoralis]|nr:hypothetical protein DPEC_G00380640 [Dallia pectoralis]